MIQTIPIVFPTVADPVAQGIVASFARPGGNLTGLSLQNPDIAGKRLQLLKEIVPNAKRIGVLINPDNSSSSLFASQVQAAAPPLGVEVLVIGARPSRSTRFLRAPNQPIFPLKCHQSSTS